MSEYYKINSQLLNEKRRLTKQIKISSELPKKPSLKELILSIKKVNSPENLLIQKQLRISLKNVKQQTTAIKRYV